MKDWDWSDRITATVLVLMSLVMVALIVFWIYAA